MDYIDTKIIEFLKSNSRITSSDISKKIHLSVPAVSERIRKLEEENIVEAYTLKLNREKFNLKLLAFIFVSLEKTEHIENFREMMKLNQYVLECHHIAGEYDYLLKVAVADTKGLEEFISNSLKKVQGVSKSNTFIALSTIKENI